MSASKIKKIRSLISAELERLAEKKAVNYLGSVCLVDGCRKYCLLPQSVFGKRFKIIVFVVDSCDISDDNSLKIPNGGTLSQEGIGHHYAWSIDSDTEMELFRRDIGLCLERIVLPWFYCVNGHEEYKHITQQTPLAAKSQTRDAKYSFKDTSWLKAACQFLKNAMTEASFRLVPSEFIRYVRVQNEITQVIQLRLINDGAHFVVDVFCWIPELHIHSTSINDDLISICGGRLSSYGVSQVGTPWLAQDFAIEKNLIQIETLLNNQAIPWLMSVKTIGDVIDNIPSAYTSMLPGIKGRLGF